MSPFVFKVSIQIREQSAIYPLSAEFVTLLFTFLGENHFFTSTLQLHFISTISKYEGLSQSLETLSLLLQFILETLDSNCDLFSGEDNVDTPK